MDKAGRTIKTNDKSTFSFKQINLPLHAQELRYSLLLVPGNLLALMSMGDQFLDHQTLAKSPTRSACPIVFLDRITNERLKRRQDYPSFPGAEWTDLIRLALRQSDSGSLDPICFKNPRYPPPTPEVPELPKIEAKYKLVVRQGESPINL